MDTGFEHPLGHATADPGGVWGVEGVSGFGVASHRNPKP